MSLQAGRGLQQQRVRCQRTQTSRVVRCWGQPPGRQHVWQRSRHALAAAAAAAEAEADLVAEQPEQRSMTLRKPVGVVFAQNKNGPVFVEELTPGGNADKSGMVQVGDVLTKCSAVVLKAGKEGQYEREGYGQRPYDNWETIMFDCEGQEFKTVMSALKSNNERWGIMNVTLVFRRPAEGGETALCSKAA